MSPASEVAPPRRTRWWNTGELPSDVEDRVQRQIRAIGRVTLRVRVWISVVGCALAVLNWSSNTLATMVGTLATAVTYGIAAAALLRLRRSFRWVVVTLDAFTLLAFSLTSLANRSGAYEILLAPHYIIMALLLMLLSALHFDVRTTLWAGTIAALLRLGTFVALARTGQVTLVDQAVYGERAVGIADQLTIVVLYLGFGALAAVVTHFSRQLLVRATNDAVRSAALEHAHANFRRYLGEAMMRDIAAGVDDTLFARALDGIVVTTASGEVLVANGAAERILGVSPLVERSILDCLPHDARGEFGAHLLRGSAHTDHLEFRLTVARPRTIESRASAMHDGVVLLTLRDISERQRFEHGLVRAARMESVGQLAGGLAHDFNNLLAGLSGHLMLLRVESGPSEAATPRLDKMERLITRAAGMARRLLVLGRGGTARAALAPEALVLAAVELVRGSFPAGTRLEVAVAGPLPTLHASARECEECLVNLLLNARDASPPGGTVTIGAASRGGFVEIFVDDEGDGIPEDQRERIFEPFYTTKTSAGGTGLGLAVVARVVREHGGTVEVASGRARGTRMVVRLPSGGAADPDEIPPALSSADLAQATTPGTARVLVVDDDAAVREAVGAMLALAGHTVSTADSADIAWRFLTGPSGFDVLVTDVAMPGETGQALATRAAQRQPDLRVVVITGFARGLDGWPQVQDGTWTCLAKPFRAVELLDAVARKGMPVDGARQDR